MMKHFLITIFLLPNIALAGMTLDEFARWAQDHESTLVSSVIEEIQDNRYSVKSVEVREVDKIGTTYFQIEFADKRGDTLLRFDYNHSLRGGHSHLANLFSDDPKLGAEILYATLSRGGNLNHRKGSNIIKACLESKRPFAVKRYSGKTEMYLYRPDNESSLSVIYLPGEYTLMGKAVAADVNKQEVKTFRLRFNGESGLTIIPDRSLAYSSKDGSKELLVIEAGSSGVPSSIVVCGETTSLCSSNQRTLSRISSSESDIRFISKLIEVLGSDSEKFEVKLKDKRFPIQEKGSLKANCHQLIKNLAES